MYTGALGHTTDVMRKALDFNGFPSTDRVAKAFSQLVTPILISPVIQMTTGIYCAQQYQIHPVWQVEAQIEFLTSVQQVNFTDTIGSAATMNAYIGNITFGEITNLMQPAWFNPNTSVVLINALYLNGPFAIPFDKKMIANQPFGNAFSGCVKSDIPVNMMHTRVSKLRCEGKAMIYVLLQSYGF